MSSPCNCAIIVVGIATALELAPYEEDIVTMAGNATVFIAIDSEGTASEIISRSLKKEEMRNNFRVVERLALPAVICPQSAVPAVLLAIVI